MDSLLEPSPLSPVEDRLRATAEADLEALRAANVGTNSLGWLLEARGLDHSQADVPSHAIYQEKALVFIGTITLRAARALMTLVCSGYEEEAFVFQRVLAEAKGRAQRVVEDDSGEHARQWLAGRAGSSAKANRELPQDIWTGLSVSAHVDVRAILRSGPSDQDDGITLQNSPYRVAERANATLALCGSQTADVAFSLAYLRGVDLPDQARVIQLIKGTLEKYLPGEDAEAWTSPEGGDIETLRQDR